MMANTAGQSGLSIVIPSWEGRELLEKFLSSVVAAAEAFAAACRQPTEIVVADDASTDGTRPWLAAHFPQVRCESSQRAEAGHGFAPTANRGVRLARYNLVYLLNNDVALERNTLPPLIGHFADPLVFAVASQVYDYSTGALRGAGQLGEFRRGFLGIHRRYFVSSPAAGLPAKAHPEASAQEGAETEAPFLTMFASGGSSLFDREKFLALGGFDESFAPFGWEDVELSLRAWKRGFEVHYEPRSAVWHQFSSTITPRFSRGGISAVYERNRLLTHWLHLDTSTQAAAHACFLALKLLSSVFVGRWETWSATVQALRRRGDVKAKRQELGARQQRALSDVLQMLAAQMERPGVEPLTSDSAPVRACPHWGVGCPEVADLRFPRHGE